MPRLRGPDWTYDPAKHGRATMDLSIGPTDRPGELTVDQLRVIWEFQRERMMRPPFVSVGRRPWAWWQFEAREHRPQDETLRLAELGELTDEELAALREDANVAKLRIGTDSERISGGWREHGTSLDVQAVKLWDAVQAVLSRSPPAAVPGSAGRHHSVIT